MALLDAQIRAAKPGAKILKLSDGGGLQLWVSPDGAKRWRQAYRFNDMQKTLAIGVYPAIGLKEAREARENAKRLLADGQEPNPGQATGQGRQSGELGQHFRRHHRRTVGQEATRGEGRANNRQGRMAV